MGIRKYWKVGVALLAVVAIVFAAALASAFTPRVSGKAITAVKAVRGENATTTNSTSFVDIPGASTTIRVPAGQSALILTRFSGESACYSTTTSYNWCSVRIKVGNKNAQPDSDFAFDSTDQGNETDGSWEAHSIDRSAIVGAGTYTVRVLYRTTSADTEFRIDDWSLTVERSKR